MIGSKKQMKELEAQIFDMGEQHRKDMTYLKSRLTEQESLVTKLEDDVRKHRLETAKLKDRIADLESEITCDKVVTTAGWLATVVKFIKAYFGK